MSSPPKEKAETRAGHPPAGTAAGSRLSALSLAGPGGPGRPRAGGAGRRFPARSPPVRTGAEEGEGGLGRVPPLPGMRARGVWVPLGSSPRGFPRSPLLGRDALGSPPEPWALLALRQPSPVTGPRSLPCLSPRRALLVAKPSSGVCSLASPGSDPADCVTFPGIPPSIGGGGLGTAPGAGGGGEGERSGLGSAQPAGLFQQRVRWVWTDCKPGVLCASILPVGVTVWVPGQPARSCLRFWSLAG